MPKVGKRQAKRRSREKASCNKWNTVHPVGTAVSVLRENGGTIQTKTIAPAIVLGGHTAVIWLAGVSGCYALERVTAIQ